MSVDVESWHFANDDSDLPMLHAHAFRKKTVPLGITVPW